MLSQILTPNRKPISFHYKDSEFIQDFGGMYTMEYRQTGSSYTPISPTAQWSGTNSVSYGKTLTHIIWDGGAVIFVSSENRDDVVKGTGVGDYKLDDVEIYNNHGLVKKYHFEYGYFSSGSTNAHRRLKLQSLTEVDISGNGKDIVQTFVYNEAVNLPSRSSFKYDHWGYFNNKGQELPTLKQNGTVDLSTKEPDLAYAQANILTDIIHPTKGKTSFEYELNQYYAGSYEYKQINIGCLAIDSSLTVGNSDTDIQNFYLPSNAEDISIVLTTQVVENMGTNNYVELNYQDDILWYWDQRHNQTHTLSSRQPGYYTLKCAIDNGKSYAQATGTVSYRVPTYTKNAGGLRVKAIRKTAFDGSPSMVTKYNYKTANGHSSGVLLKSMPAYIRNRTEYISQYSVGDLLWCTGVPYNNVIIYTGLTPADFAPSPVGYHTVTVSRGDNDENGKTVHTFRMGSYGLNDVSWMFGQPLTENTYRADGTLLSSLENIYTVVNDNVPGVTALSAEQIGSHYCAEDYTFNQSYPRQYEQTYSTAIQGWVRLDKTIVTNYHPEPSGTQTSFAKITDYTYDAYHQVNSIVEDAGNNQKLITEFRYPQDKSDPVFVQMKNENRVSDVILKRQIQQNGNDISSRKMLSASYVKYANVPVGSVNVPKVESQYVLETLAPVNVMTSVPEGPCTQLPCFEKQITMQYSSPALDPVLVTDKTNQKFTMVWGFHHDLIAQVVNATPDQVAYSSMERESQNWILGGWTVLVPTPNVEIIYPVAKTGKRCATQIKIGKTNLPPGQYHLSYHVRGTGSVNVNGTTMSVNEADWKYNINKVAVTSTADVVSLQANEGVFIDEVRLYPVGASMKTFWSEIMVGVKSITDENGVTSYFQYDGLNRLGHITDDKLSIIQSFEYNLKK